MINRLLSLVIFLIALSFLLLILSATWILIPMDTVDSTEKIVHIPYGFNSSQIRQLLEEEGIIRPYNFIFQLMTKFMYIDEKLQSGEYVFRSSQNLVQIIDQLVKGKVVLYRMTIPEGYQAKQIALLLEEKEIAVFDDFLQLIQVDNEYQEGYLFPDTYEFPKNFGADNVLKLMKKNFEEIVSEHVSPEQEFPLGLNFHEVIILASIIEKEAQGEEDKPKIASVFYNRLAEGMRLQSCATIQYLLEKPQERLTQLDLEIESPFNTYIYPGLPPAPICNPGLDSILAAVNPAEEDYLYFVLGKDGKHVFTRTYQEHLENKP
jgi:UPF0755 protein